jgi:hypothetical protein
MAKIDNNCSTEDANYECDSSTDWSSVRPNSNPSNGSTCCT